MQTPNNNRRKQAANRAVCYYRCASRDPADQQPALDLQRAVCQVVVARRGLRVIDEFADIGECSFNRFRLGLADLISTVRANAPVTVVVADPTRLGRSYADLVWVRDQIEQTGSTILTATDSIEAHLRVAGMSVLLSDHPKPEERP